jgi:hypothetical protein
MSRECAELPTRRRRWFPFRSKVAHGESYGGLSLVRDITMRGSSFATREQTALETAHCTREYRLRAVDSALTITCEREHSKNAFIQSIPIYAVAIMTSE